MLSATALRDAQHTLPNLEYRGNPVPKKISIQGGVSSPIEATLVMSGLFLVMRHQDAISTERFASGYSKYCVTVQEDAVRDASVLFNMPRCTASCHSSSTFFATKQNDEPISDNFDLQLAIVPSLRVLSILELSDAITFGFAFEDKVLCKYGTYKIPKASYTQHLKADLIDRESKNTVTFVVIEVFVNENVESFDVGEYVRIEGVYVKRKVWKDGGTSMWALYANVATLIVKLKSFDCCLHLYPKHRIKVLLADKGVIEFAPTIDFTVVKVETSTRADGGDSYRLTIADGPASSERASVSD
ncbi:hypothetical protein L7F22_069150 [Adiantum nelumboides]|nr:hypothetical protein [Adiantum nelumboides]